MKILILISIVFLYVLLDIVEGKRKIMKPKRKRFEFLPLPTGSTVCNESHGFRSIFTIGNTIYFQAVRTNMIWKLNETAYTFSKENYTGYKIPKNYNKINPDYDLMNDLKDIFDLRKPIFGHIVYPTDKDCLNDTTSDCYIINKNTLDEFVCMYGYSSFPIQGKSIQFYMALHYTNQRIRPFKSEEVKSKINTQCKLYRDYKFANGSIFGALNVNDDKREYSNNNNKIHITNRWLQLSVNSPTLYTSPLYLVLRNTENNFRKEIEIPSNTIFNIFSYPFTYGGDFVIFGCPLVCFKDSMLKIIDRNFTIIDTNLTLNDLFRCHNKTLFKPNNFCQQNDFKSIFNLGSDIYFQNMGKFWRYSSSSFSNVGNFKFEPSVSGIRFDSDIVDFLEKEGFDTIRAIKGFTYKSYKHDACVEGHRPVDEKCDKIYLNYPDYRMCLIGYSVKPNPVTQYYRRFDAYVYYPSGVSKFKNLYNYNETYVLCKRLFMLSVNPDNDTGPELVAVINMFTTDWIHINKSEENMIMTYAKLEFSLFYYRTEIHIPIQQNLRFEDISIHAPQLIKPFEEYLVRDIFFYDRKNDFFAVPFKKPAMVEEIYAYDPKTSRRLKQNTTIHFLSLIFGCKKNLPFIQSHSLVLLEYEDPCHDFNSKSTVFNIGDYMYLKVNRLFYVYFYKHFYLDKYISDLFNDYFDTRHRLTVYSYRFDKRMAKNFYVMAMGRTKYSFKEFGKYMFATFIVLHHGFGEVRPLNNVLQMKHAVITYGNNYWTYSQRLLPAADFFFPFFVEDIEDKMDRQPFVVFVNDFEYYMTYSWEYFEFGLMHKFAFETVSPMYLFKVSRIDPDTALWTKVIGLAHDDFQLYLFTWIKNTSEVGVFVLSNSSGDIHTVHKLTELKSSDIIPLRDVMRCRNVEYPTDSESSETELEKIPVKWILWLVILILIALFVAIVVYIAIQNRKQSNEINKNVTQKPFDAQNGNKNDKNLSDSVTNNEEKQSQYKDETNEDKVEVNDEIQVKSDESSVRSSE